MLENVLAGLVAGGLSSALMLFLVRSIFSQLLQRDLERYKIELRAERDMELERLRSELHVASAQREMRFSSLHERRVTAMTDAYAKLMSATLTHQQLLSDSSPAAITNALAAGTDFMTAIGRAQVVLPRDLARKLGEIGRLLWVAYSRITVGDDRLNSLQEIRHILEVRALALRDEIEEAIRAELGDHPPD